MKETYKEIIWFSFTAGTLIKVEGSPILLGFPHLKCYGHSRQRPLKGKLGGAYSVNTPRSLIGIARLLYLPLGTYRLSETGETNLFKGVKPFAELLRN